MLKRTGRKRLLELVGLLGVLKDKGVQVTAAADLELDLRGTLGGLLFTPGGDTISVSSSSTALQSASDPPLPGRGSHWWIVGIMCNGPLSWQLYVEAQVSLACSPSNTRLHPPALQPPLPLL